jgi:hypothetical protein
MREVGERPRTSGQNSVRDKRDSLTLVSDTLRPLVQVVLIIYKFLFIYIRSYYFYDNLRTKPRRTYRAVVKIICNRKVSTIYVYVVSPFAIDPNHNSPTIRPLHE